MYSPNARNEFANRVLARMNREFRVKLASRFGSHRIDIMSDQTPIERRLAALEREVSELKQRLNNGNAQVNWIERITGSMADFPEFEDVIRFGREIREADRPAVD